MTAISTLISPSIRPDPLLAVALEEAAAVDDTLDVSGAPAVDEVPADAVVPLQTVPFKSDEKEGS